MAAPFITLILAPGKALLELDAVVAETHQTDVEVTEHPVEVGANVSDHARLKAGTLTIEGIVSNTPLNRTQARRVVAASGVRFESTSTGDAPAGAPGYAEGAYAKLLAVIYDRQLVTIVTQIRTYKKMIMTSLTVPRNAQTGDAVRFSASFKEVRLAEVRLQEIIVKKEPKARKKVNVGKQVAKPADTATKDSVVKGLDRNTFGGGIKKFFTFGGG